MTRDPFSVLGLTSSATEDESNPPTGSWPRNIIRI